MYVDDDIDMERENSPGWMMIILFVIMIFIFRLCEWIVGGMKRCVMRTK